MSLPVRSRAQVPYDNTGQPQRYEQVAVKPGDIVRVHNLDDVDYEFTWDSIPHLVPANGDGFMPFECAAHWFGDPRSTSSIRSNRDNRGLVGFIPDRDTEVRRVKMLYGDNMGGSELVFDSVPHVEVYDVNNNRILSVIDDPRGEAVNATVSTASDAASLQAQVLALQAQVSALAGQTRAAQDVTEPANAPDAEHDGDQDDDPTRLQVPNDPEEHDSLPVDNA